MCTGRNVTTHLSAMKQVKNECACTHIHKGAHLSMWAGVRVMGWEALPILLVKEEHFRE